MSDVNYLDINNWLSFGGDKSKDVDVFVIYPTVTSSYEEADKPFVRINSKLMRNEAAGWLSQTGSIVSEAANIYAPLYRQLNGIMLNSLAGNEFTGYIDSTPRDDIFAAFSYYLENINKGERPFVLFGQSQGAKLAIELATTFLGSEKYYKYNKNHVASYAIGCSVTEEEIAKNPGLKFSQSKNDTGTIVSWNTTAPSEVASGEYRTFITWKPNALVTNPISWETNEILARATKADAMADKKHGVLITTANESGYKSMTPNIGKFHHADLMLYCKSVKQNIKDRVENFYH